MLDVQILRDRILAVISLLLGAAATRPASADPPEVAGDDRLTTGEWREPDIPNDVGWELLRLPEFATRLALSPLLPLVALAEDVRLDRRIVDLLTNDERTSLLLPLVVVLGRDGTGAGLSYRHSDLLGGGEELVLRGLLKQNLDHDASVSYRDRVTSLGNRAARLELEHELDRNERFFGLGGESRRADESALSVRSERLQLGAELLAIHSRSLGGRFAAEARLGSLVERLEPGTDDDLPPVGRDPSPPPPPGFEHTAWYVQTGTALHFDSRPTRGPADRGLVTRLEADGFRDASGAPLSALAVRAQGALFVPLARGRTLVIVIGGGDSEPLHPAHGVPLPAHVELGRTTYLRGHAKKRFRDTAGWWSALEYHYPVLEYGSADIGIDAFLFLDAGRVGSSPRQTLSDPIRHSYGFGARAYTSEAFVLRLLVGLSPEGTELSLALNEEL